uniref:Uncharacterized protein n=1 Tax=Avena sativa TaxID=4498 RepID=A0ACD5UQE9_AVESA
MARDSGSRFHFCGIAIVVHGGSLSDRDPSANNPGGGRTRPPREVVEISSDEEEEEVDGSALVARKLRFDEVGDEGANLGVGKKKSESCCGKEDEDCVVLDSDPDGAVAVGEENGSAGFGGSSDDLLIVAEKGQVACRDFPHPRHLCSILPFISTSHFKHCSMCYCFVCDAPAPCIYWGTGVWTDDHCHGTDKEMRWKILRQAIKCGPLPASHLDQHQAVLYPAMEPHRQQDIQRQVSTPQSDPSFLSGNTVGAPRASPLTRDGRGGENAHTARATRLETPFRQALYQRGEDEEYTSEDDEYTSQKAKVYVGNLDYDIVSEDLDELFGQAGFVEFSEVMYSQQTGQSRGFGFVTMSSVKDAELAVKMFNGFDLQSKRIIGTGRRRRGSTSLYEFDTLHLSSASASSASSTSLSRPLHHFLLPIGIII